MTTFNDYLNGNNAAGAMNKEFSLYGMRIGKFTNMSDLGPGNKAFIFRRGEEAMTVPMIIKINSLPNAIGNVINPMLFLLIEINKS